MSKRTLNLQEVAAAVGGTYVGVKSKVDPVLNLDADTVAYMKKLGFKFAKGVPPLTFATLGDVSSDVYAEATSYADGQLRIGAYVLGTPFKFTLSRAPTLRNKQLDKLTYAVTQAAQSIKTLTILED